MAALPRRWDELAWTDFARLPRDAKPGDAAQVEIRGKPVPARVVRPPFVRNGKALV